MFTFAQTSSFSAINVLHVRRSPHRRSICTVGLDGIADVLALRTNGDDYMLGIIAAVLIVLWLLGFFAFHVTSAFIHAALIVGLILLVLHLISGRTANA